MKKILLIGEPMALLMAQQDGELKDVELYKRGVAGAELNVAIGLNRLGYDVLYLSKVGNDPFGHHIIDYINNEQICTNNIMISKEHQTGIQLKSKVSKGDPEAPYYRDHSAASTINISDLDNINFDDITLIHLTGIPLAISASLRKTIYEVIRIAHQKKIFITFDPNIRYELWKDNNDLKKTVNDVASKANLFLPGLKEAQFLSGKENEEDIYMFYKLNYNIDNIIIKNGHNGAILFQNNKKIKVKAFNVKKIVDTVGAGDGFSVGVIHGILQQKSLLESLHYGNAIGAIQVQNPTDNEGLPTVKELELYINNT